MSKDAFLSSGPALQVEQQVLHFLNQMNRPYNTQLVADNLAQYGVKKGPIQKALDSLSEQAKIICKVDTSHRQFLFFAGKIAPHISIA